MLSRHFTQGCWGAAVAMREKKSGMNNVASFKKSSAAFLNDIRKLENKDKLNNKCEQKDWKCE